MKIISPEKAQLIAERYCCNGFSKRDALIDAGYSPGYAKTSAGTKVFENPVVKAEIDKIMQRNAEVADVRIEEVIRGLRSIAFPGNDVKVANSDKNRALELLGKYLAMFTDRYIEKAEPIKPPTAAERAILQEAASKILLLGLNKPQEAQESD